MHQQHLVLSTLELMECCAPRCRCAAVRLQSGGLTQLLDLLESKQINLQHNAAFALYGLSDNEDNIPCIIQAGGLQRLYDCSERLQVQASKVRDARGKEAATVVGLSAGHAAYSWLVWVGCC